MSRTAATAALCSAIALLAACGPTARPPESGRPVGNQETGAVETLHDSALAGPHVESIVELLRGRVPGLEVVRQANGDISLRIRGGDVSLLGDAAGPREPLLVIDGMAVSTGNVTRALESLRPHEIDRIQVLRDVASTSVYGTRGAHGVILITTKRD